MIDFIPDAQTLLMVVASVVLGMLNSIGLSLSYFIATAQLPVLHPVLTPLRWKPVWQDSDRYRPE